MLGGQSPLNTLIDSLAKRGFHIFVYMANPNQLRWTGVNNFLVISYLLFNEGRNAPSSWRLAKLYDISHTLLIPSFSHPSLFFPPQNTTTKRKRKFPIFSAMRFNHHSNSNFSGWIQQHEPGSHNRVKNHHFSTFHNHTPHQLSVSDVVPLVVLTPPAQSKKP